jgi:hypothetical protein
MTPEVRREDTEVLHYDLERDTRRRDFGHQKVPHPGRDDEGGGSETLGFS